MTSSTHIEMTFCWSPTEFNPTCSNYDIQNMIVQGNKMFFARGTQKKALGHNRFIIFHPMPFIAGEQNKTIYISR